MNKLIENLNGTYHFQITEGDSVTVGMPFTKEETREFDGEEKNIFDHYVSLGYEVVETPQAEKDAHAQAQLIEQATSQVQSMLDTEAQARGYDNINSIAKYMGYDNPFRAECEALGAWCASCWSKCYELQAGGVMPDDLLAEMPELVI